MTGWKRRLRVLWSVGIAASLLYVAGGFGAARYLTMPFRARVRDLSPGRRVVVRAPDGPRIALFQSDAPGARGTAVLAHGYRNDRRLLQMLAPALAARGFRALALDFRAHGESEGDRITFGALEARDVGAVIDHARSLGGPVVYVGFSMGAVAYLLSGREADAAVLDSPYATLRLALRWRMRAAGIPAPLGLSTIAFLSARLPAPVDTVRPVDAARGLSKPTLFVFAERDHWVSPEARALYREVLATGSAIDEIAGAGHADHFSGAWVERVATFLAEATKGL